MEKDVIKIENKYYKPKINELYIGFKCEITWDRFAKKNKFIYIDWVSNEQEENIYWENVNLELLHIINFDDKENRYNSFDIRVKYLDKEDIENLGFEYGEYSKKSIGGEIIELYNIPYTHIWSIFHINEFNREQLFKGYIMNKSDLEILLKKLI